MFSLLSRLPRGCLSPSHPTWHLSRLCLSTWTKEDTIKATKILNPHFSAYVFFVRETNKEFNALGSKLDVSARTQEISSKWKSLTEDERNKVLAEYQRERKWAQKVVDESNPVVLSAVAKKKRGLSGFNLFVREYYSPSSDKEENLLHSMAQLWNALPESTKEEYNTRASNMRQRYMMRSLRTDGKFTWEEISEAKKLLRMDLTLYKFLVSEAFKETRKSGNKVQLPSRLKEISANWQAMTKDEEEELRKHMEQRKMWARKVLAEADPVLLEEITGHKRSGRGMNGYNLFIKENYWALSGKHADAKQTIKVLAQNWKRQPDSFREEYNARAMSIRQAYEAAAGQPDILPPK